MEKELVMYSRSTGCPFVTLAKRVLDEHEIAYQEIFIDLDLEARDRVKNWTGFHSVPTLIVANSGEILPYETPDPIDAGISPRGINRGTMITEPNIIELTDWLKQHQFIKDINHV